MATKIPIQGVIKINDREVKNTYNGLLTEMRKVEKELKNLTVGTKEYEEKSKHLKEVSERFDGVNQEIKKQKGLLRETGASASSFSGVMHNLRGALAGNTSELAKGSASFSSFGSTIVSVARTAWTAISSIPIVGWIAAAVSAIGLFTKELFEYNDKVLSDVKLIQNKFGDLGTDADELRNKINGVAETYGLEYKRIIDTVDTLSSSGLGTQIEAIDAIKKGLANTDNVDNFLGKLDQAASKAKQTGINLDQVLNLTKALQGTAIDPGKIYSGLEKASAKLSMGLKDNKNMVEILGKSFTEDLISDIQTGSITIIDALKRVKERGDELNISVLQQSKLASDFFGRTSASAGAYQEMLRLVDEAYTDQFDSLTDLQKQTDALADANIELEKAKDRALKSDSLIKFIEAFKIGWAKAKTIFYDTITFIGDLFKSTFSNIDRILKEFGISTSAILKFIKQILSAMGVALSQTFGSVNEKLSTLADSVIALKRVVVKNFHEMVEFIQSIAHETKEVLKDFLNPFASADTSKLRKTWENFANKGLTSFADEFKKVKNERKKDLTIEFTANTKPKSPPTENDDDTDGGVTGDGGNANRQKVKAKNGAKKTHNLEEALNEEKKWNDALLASRRKFWDEAHAMDEKGLERELKQNEEKTKRKIEDLDRENEKILEQKAKLAEKIKSLEKEAKSAAPEEITKIKTSILRYEESMKTMERILELHQERKATIVENGKIEEQKIREKYNAKEIEEKQKLFDVQQKKEKAIRLAEITLMKASAKEKAALKQGLARKQLIDQLKFLKETNQEIEKFLIEGKGANLGIADMILSEEAKNDLVERLKALGLSMEEIQLILAQIKGGAGDDFQGVGFIQNADVLGMNAESWEQMFQNLDSWKGKLEMMVGVTQAMQQTWSKFHDFQMKKEQEALRKFEANANRKKDALKKQLDEGYINQKEYDAKVKAIEEGVNKRRAEMEYKQAKYEKQNAIIASIINTALGVSASLAKGGPWGIALAAVVGAMGAAQTAMIASQPLPPKQGYAKGGATIGLGFKDETGHEVAGVVHADEYVIPAWMRKQPEVAKVEQWLEAKRTGKDKPYAEGGAVQKTNAVEFGTENLKTNEFYQLLLGALIRNSEVLEDIEKNGVKSYIVADEKAAKIMMEAQKRYEAMKNKNIQ